MKKLIFTLLVAYLLCQNNLGAYAVPLSPGIEVLEEDCKLIKCTVGGQKLSFTPTEFEDLAGTEFDSITLDSLPPLSAGVLKVGGVDAIEGQKLSATGVALLSFAPVASFKESCSFDFTVTKGKKDRSYKCLIRYSDTPRFAPIAVNNTLTTYKDVSVSADLKAYDPDGDPIEYRIQRYPTGGTLTIKDGVATYTPAEGFSGKDSFSYYAVDDWGKESAPAIATVTVTDSQSGIYFADMEGSQNHLAAIRMAETEVMTYRCLGESYYFNPTATVSRIDFAVMLVSACGISVPSKQYPTNVFTDTYDESHGKRLYLEAAVTNGLVEAGNPCFRPTESITVAEAIAMTERALEGDSPSIGTAWKENSDATLTKADAAELLWTVYNR